MATITGQTLTQLTLSVVEKDVENSYRQYISKKIQNMISTYHNMVCYNCFKKLRSMRVIPQAKKTKEK